MSKPVRRYFMEDRLHMCVRCEKIGWDSRMEIFCGHWLCNRTCRDIWKADVNNKRPAAVRAAKDKNHVVL